jgi:putative spermidine/putrescine transport system permease protein
VAAMTNSSFGLHRELEGVESSLRRTPRREGAPLHKVIMAWLILIVAMGYFLLPLLGTLLFSLRAQPFGQAWGDTVNDARLWSSLGYSFIIAVITIVASTVLLVPTAFWVRLRVPRLRPVVEFVTLMPFVIPPIVLVYGLIQTFSGPPFPFTATNQGSDALLVCAYVVLSFPYMYRSIDAGLRTIDIRGLTEASQSLGAGWPTTMWRVILPNLRVAILSGAFLTLAIVMGEFTVANFLARQSMFAVYLQQMSGNLAYQPAAVVLISFAMTWAAMGVIAWIGRGRTDKVKLAGAH